MKQRVYEILTSSKIQTNDVILKNCINYRGVFSTGAMGALAPAIFGHFNFVGKIVGAKQKSY